MPVADELVSVALWRGYVTGCFYARPAGSDVALAVSPSFRIVRLPWERRAPLDRNPRAVGALDALEQTLVEGGWRRIAGVANARWYQLWFGRPPRVGDVVPGPTSAGSADRLTRPPDDEPSNGHPQSAVVGEILAALGGGPLASGELRRRVGRSSEVVRAARRELELAGLVQRASPPPGRSRRATYWQLSSSNGHLAP